MAVRIRVYPQNGALGAMGMGMQGGAVSAQTYYTQKLQTQQQVSNLRLGYERALFNEKLDKVRLEERLKNPYAMMGAGAIGGYGMNPYAGALLTNPLLANPMLAQMGQTQNFFGSLGLGGFF